MKEYGQIIKALTNSLWLMEENSLAMMLNIINERLAGLKQDQDSLMLRIENADHGDRELSRIESGGGVGMMPIYGPIFPKSNLMTEMSGATSLQNVRSDLQTLLSDDKVKTIVMDIDSPGGSADMIEETGALIRAAREQKPIVAVANTDANSGAYWLASQASEFYATPSGKVGSVGVYIVHEDNSESDKAQGRKVTFVSAGEYKTAGNPHEPLSEKARAYIQEHVDAQMDKFVGAIAEGRGVTKEQVNVFADGRIYMADKALSMGMVDGVKSLDSVVDGLLAETHTPRIRSTLQGAMVKHRQNALKMEHADLEHSEPGTGSPPERRTDNDIPEDEMYRIETPKFVFDLETEEEGSMEELLIALRSSLGLKEDASEADVLAAYNDNLASLSRDLNAETNLPALASAAREVNAEMAPLREAAAHASKRNAFRDEFPEEYEKMRSLEATDKDNKAKAFAGNFSRFQVMKDGQPTQEKSPYGFSALVLSDIEQAHKDIADRTFTAGNLEDMLLHIANNGIVDYSERGSSREKEGRVVARTGSTGGNESRQAFAAFVAEIMEQDGLDYDAAIKEAAKREPELFAAYRAPAVADN